MNFETHYAYQKKIRELEAENKRLASRLYDYKSALTDIYDGAVEVLGKHSTTINISWVISKCRRVWQ